MSRTIAATALLLLAACGPPAKEATANRVVPITPDVKLDHVLCTADELGARAEGTLTNRSRQRKTFVLSIEWYGRDGKYYTGAEVTTPPITPGDVATWEAHPGTPAAVGGVCEVVEVREVPDVEQEAAPAWGDGS